MMMMMLVDSGGIRCLLPATSQQQVDILLVQLIWQINREYVWEDFSPVQESSSSSSVAWDGSGGGGALQIPQCDQPAKAGRKVERLPRWRRVEGGTGRDLQVCAKKLETRFGQCAVDGSEYVPLAQMRNK